MVFFEIGKWYEIIGIVYFVVGCYDLFDLVEYFCVEIDGLFNVFVVVRVWEVWWFVFVSIIGVYVGVDEIVLCEDVLLLVVVLY